MQNAISFTIKKVLFFCFGLALVCALLPSVSFAACNGAKPKCSAALSSSANGGCIPTTTSGGVFTNNSSNQMKASCLSEKLKNGCFNSTPASFIGSYNMAGWRKKSEGGKRNHNGSDMETGGRNNVVAYASAKGTVKGCAPSGSGGRTTVINHQKQCESSKGPSTYSTIYRHLYKQTKCSGSVEKDGKIGIVGGSNYHRKSGKLCDNALQGGGPVGSCKPYAIHSHVEIIDGDISHLSTSVTGRTVMQISCGGLQALCGDCPVNTDSCKGAQSNFDDGTRASGDEENLGPDGDASGEPSKCSAGDYFDKSDCVTCGLFTVIFNAASGIAGSAISKLAEPSKGIVLIGFSIWLAIYILKQIASFQKSSPADMLKGIILQGTRVAVVVLILSGSLFWVMDLTLNPVMQTGLSFAQTLNPNSTCSGSYVDKVKGYKGNLDASASDGLPNSMGTSIVCTIKNLEDSVGMLAAFGNYAICLAFYDKAVWDGVIPHLGYLLSGVFLWASGIFLLLTFPWLLVDCILQLCIAAAMIPCAVASFAFKSTTKYIGIVWNFFMNAMFTLVFMAILVYILNSMFQDWIGLPDDLSEFDVTRFLSSGEGGLAWWGLAGFKILAICFLYICFFGEAGKMAGLFANGMSFSGGGIGSKVGSVVNETGKRLGTGAAKMTASAAGAVGQGINALAGNQFRSGMNHLKGKAIQKLGGRELKDADGNVVGYQARFKILGFTQTRTVTKDANGRWVQTKETHQTTKADKAFKPMKDAQGNTTWGVKTKDAEGNTVYEQMKKTVDAKTGNIIYTSKDGKSQLVTDKNGKILKYKRDKDDTMQQEKSPGSVENINDGIMHRRVMRDKNGNIISENTEFKINSAKHIINKDGSINMHAYNQIMQNVKPENREAAMRAIAEKALAARGQKLDKTFKNSKTTMNPDGSLTISQLNNDGTLQNIQVQMMDGHMITTNRITDTKGNITVQKSNGTMSRIQKYQRQKDGTYVKSTRYAFTDEVHSRSRLSPPLDKDGVWGYGINPQDAMKGFTKEDFDKHLSQLNRPKNMETMMEKTTFKDLLNLQNELTGNAQEKDLLDSAINQALGTATSNPEMLKNLDNDNMMSLVMLADKNIKNKDGNVNQERVNAINQIISQIKDEEKAKLLKEDISAELKTALQNKQEVKY